MTPLTKATSLTPHSCTDRAYRNAPLFSPTVYRSVLYEWDKQLCRFFHERNMPVILHSDGNLWPLTSD